MVRVEVVVISATFGSDGEPDVLYRHLNNEEMQQILEAKADFESSKQELDEFEELKKMTITITELTG